MLFVISPAKSLDFATPPVTEVFTLPSFLSQSATLIAQLRQLNAAQVATLMGISDQLAALNVARFAQWHTPFTLQNAKQAVLAFNGDVYEGLAAHTMNVQQFAYLQTHARILSGLYGILRPLDLLQAYRLEMGTRLPNAQGKDLYAFWGDTLVQAINRELTASKTTPQVLVNLASAEYFKVLQPKGKTSLTARVITPVFEDWQGGKYRVVSFYAKRARGLMVRYAALHNLRQPEKLKNFNLEGYAFAASVSSDNTWVFQRQSAS